MSINVLNSSCCSAHEERGVVVGEEEEEYQCFKSTLKKKIVVSNCGYVQLYNAHEDGSGVVGKKGERTRTDRSGHLLRTHTVGPWQSSW